MGSETVMDNKRIAKELVAVARDLLSFDRRMLQMVWKDASKQFKRKMRMDLPSLAEDPAWKQFERISQKFSKNAEKMVSEGRMTKEEVHDEMARKALAIMVIQTEVLGDSVDPMERERASKMFVQLHKWTMKKLDTLPSTAPVAAQILENMNEFDKRLRGKGGLSGKEAVEAVIKAMSGLYTVDAPPLRRLWRKYGDPVEEMLYKYRILP